MKASWFVLVLAALFLVVPAHAVEDGAVQVDAERVDLNAWMTSSFGSIASVDVDMMSRDEPPRTKPAPAGPFTIGLCFPQCQQFCWALEPCSVGQCVQVQACFP